MQSAIEQTSNGFSDNEISENADFLSFSLANELYGVDIRDVEEIRVWEKPTPIPRAPSYVKGVINLRGMIVPVVDLRSRFHVGHCTYVATTVVLVLRHVTEDSERLMGLVVDAVADVVSQGDKELTVALGESQVTPFILGLLNVDEQVMSLLDTEALLDMDTILKAR